MLFKLYDINKNVVFQHESLKEVYVNMIEILNTKISLLESFLSIISKEHALEYIKDTFDSIRSVDKNGEESYILFTTVLMKDSYDTDINKMGMVNKYPDLTLLAFDLEENIFKSYIYVVAIWPTSEEGFTNNTAALAVRCSVEHSSDDNTFIKFVNY